MLRKLVLLLLLWSAAVSSVLADVSVSLDVSPRSGSIDDVFQVNVTFTGRNAGQISQPQFEKSESFAVQAAGTSTNMTFVNGTYSQQTSFAFNLSPDPSLKPGTYEIPQGFLQTDRGKVLLKRPSVEIVTKSAATRDTEPSGIDFVQLVNNNEPYVGEQILYQAQIVTSSRLAEASLSDPQFPGFWHESFGQNSVVERRVQSTGAKIYAYQDALFALKAGELTLPPRVLTGQIIVARRQTRSELMDPFNSFIPDEMFGFGRYAKKRIVAPEIKVSVKPLPPRPDAGTTYIPVGKVRIRQSISSESVKQGESITFGYEIAGNANLRPLDLPLQGLLDKDQFKIYPDKPSVEATLRDGAIEQRKVFTYAIVPLQSGKLEIPSFPILVFNPKTENYEQLKTKAVTLNVSPDPNYRNVPSPAPASKKDSTAETTPTAVDGLQPQISGAALSKSSLKLNNFYFWLLLLVPPLVALPYIVRRLIRLAASGQDLLRQRVLSADSARDKLLALSAADQNAEVLWTELQTYLLNKFDIKKPSLTAHEALQLIKNHTASPETLAQADKIFAELDRARYGRQHPLPPAAIEATKMVVAELEESYR